MGVKWWGVRLAEVVLCDLEMPTAALRRPSVILRVSLGSHQSQVRVYDLSAVRTRRTTSSKVARGQPMLIRTKPSK